MTRGSEGTGSRVQVVYLWGHHALGYRLLAPGDALSLGVSKRATFVAPPTEGWPGRMPMVEMRRKRMRLRIWPGMVGRLRRGEQTIELAPLFESPGRKRLLRGPAAHREIELLPGDAGEVTISAAGQLRLRFAHVDAPPTIGRQPLTEREPLLLRSLFWSAVVSLSALILIIYFGDRVADEPLALSAERFAKARTILESPAVKVATLQAKAAAEERERKRREKEAAESRRAKEAQGKLGRTDADRKETIIPKGRQDILREKVSRTGLLAALGSTKAPGSGLGKLLARTDSGEMEQALNGLEGAKLAAGRGAGGLGHAGTGLGGGGTSFGRIAGSGNLDVGAGRGRGRKGPSLGTGREKEVSVGMSTGTPDAEGGLTKEQINRVVRAHAAAVKYCYEKELQRAPNLSGRIDLFWVIRTSGLVDRVKVARSTLENHNVESCIERQIRNWQFPKSDAETIVQSYPFLFKGGA